MTLIGLTLAWYIGQAFFGALTVTWKLYPAIVTGHLLGGMGLLALLAVQAPARAPATRRARARDRAALWLAALALLLQIALGGWVSTNYAVLACTGFPQCNGQWWPAMNWSEGFTFARELGRRADGAPIAMTALVAIQWTHRLFAAVFVAAMGWLVARLWARGPTARRRGCHHRRPGGAPIGHRPVERRARLAAGGRAGAHCRSRGPGDLHRLRSRRRPELTKSRVLSP